MTEYKGHKRSTYECVDRDQESLLNSNNADHNGALFYHVEAGCGAACLAITTITTKSSTVWCAPNKTPQNIHCMHAQMYQHIASYLRCYVQTSFVIKFFANQLYIGIQCETLGRRTIMLMGTFTYFFT